VTDWLADLSESVQVLIAEQTPSAQSWALSVSLLPPPPPPQPAARTTRTTSDEIAKSNLGKANRVICTRD
jgi:hypothetical protein